MRAIAFAEISSGTIFSRQMSRYVVRQSFVDILATRRAFDDFKDEVNATVDSLKASRREAQERIQQRERLLDAIR